MTKAIWAIAKTTVKESIRDRILITLAIFSVLLLAATIFLGSISLDQDSKIIIDMGLFGIFFFGVIVTIFLGGASVIKELDQRTAYTILTRPISRLTFILGKFSGLCLTLLILTAAMSAVLLALVGYRLGWTAITASLLLALLYTYLEFTILVALTILFSSFSSAIMSTVYALAIFIIGHSSATIINLTRSLHSWPRYIFTGIYYILPNLEKFNLRNDAAYHLKVNPAEVGLTILYTLLYCTILLTLANRALKKQEF